MSQPSGESDPQLTAPPKAAKACVKCRRLKMKCRVDQGPSCRRCLRSNVPCIFKPRANAASTQESPPPGDVSNNTASWNPSSSQRNSSLQSVLERLDVIESFLALDKRSNNTTEEQPDEDPSDPNDPALLGLWTAVAKLKASSRVSQNGKIWTRSIIRQLFLSFHTSMPGLHFLPTKQTFSTPTPLLLASMLYVSSLRHTSPELALMAPDYFVIMCEAIADLTIPHPETEASMNMSAIAAEESAFQDVLGLILAGLTCEATTKTTGIWISIGYRLVLESCPKEVDERSREWQRLFSGLQILDLEHASLHMSCPIIPLQAPLPRLHMSADDDLYGLTQMMHTGLTHFTGRGLPTIWSCFSAPVESPLLTSPFTAVDAAVIRDWASQLDRWLARFNTSSRRFKTENDRMVIFRQYILHRLLVLSVYHPARGFNLFSTSTTSVERHELLVSARAALRMQFDDKSIWSNWDFVMITWAALLVLQGIEGGAGENDDLPLVQDLLNTLRATPHQTIGLRNQLATKLESSFQNIHTPQAENDFPPPNMNDLLSWSIFDEMSLQFAYPDQWQIHEPL